MLYFPHELINSSFAEIGKLKRHMDSVHKGKSGSRSAEMHSDQKTNVSGNVSVPLAHLSGNLSAAGTFGNGFGSVVYA